MYVNFSSLTNRSLIGRILRGPLRLIPDETPLPILQGPLLGKLWLAGSHTHGCWLGSYEPGMQKRFSSEIGAGQVVFDIGANVGFYSLLASVQVGQLGSVYSFEPVERNTRILKRHLQINHLENVTILEVAVSDFDGECSFDDTSGPATGHISDIGRLQVQCATIDSLVSNEFVRPPECLKIDVEGAELRVLAGAKSVLEKFHPKIFLSTHGSQAQRECSELLRCVGYSLEPLKLNDNLRCDEFFARAVLERRT